MFYALVVNSTYTCTKQNYHSITGSRLESANNRTHEYPTLN